MKKYEKASFRNHETSLKISSSFFKIAHITIHRHFKNYCHAKKKEKLKRTTKKNENDLEMSKFTDISNNKVENMQNGYLK